MERNVALKSSVQTECSVNLRCAIPYKLNGKTPLDMNFLRVVQTVAKTHLRESKRFYTSASYTSTDERKKESERSEMTDRTNFEFPVDLSHTHRHSPVQTQSARLFLAGFQLTSVLILLIGCFLGQINTVQHKQSNLHECASLSVSTHL